jgi:hypothetical protein
MLRLKSKITFTNKTQGTEIVFDFVNDVEIESSYENLTDTARITIPRKLNFDGQPIVVGLNSLFKRGDKVKIELGYFPNLRTVFNGYITKISTNAPIVIECDDAMYILKQTIVTYPKKYSLITQGKTGKHLKKAKVISDKITLQELLDNIIPDDVEYKCLLDVNIGSFRASNVSVARVLDTLKSDYGFYSYFDIDGVLNVGLASNASTTNTLEFGFEDNIIDDSSLSYQRKDDVRLKVKAISINSSDNSRITVDVGDDDGVQKTVYTQNTTESDLIKFANLKLDALKYEGYNGTFETFGEPFVRHGDAGKLTSKKYPEKNGTYSITSVNRHFGMNGYRQRIQLGIKLS